MVPVPFRRIARFVRGLGLVLSVCVSIGGIAGCARNGSPVGTSGFAELDAAAGQELVAARRGSPGFVILDVRTPAEFAAERIEGAVNIDFRSPTFRAEIARLDREATYFLYCRTGNRSGQSLPLFQELGFRDVRHLTRGIVGWKALGNPTAAGG